MQAESFAVDCFEHILEPAPTRCQGVLNFACGRLQSRIGCLEEHRPGRMSSKPETVSENETQELAERVAQGDRAAENQIVQQYAGRVMAMAVVRTRDREVASELVNDVLMATIEALRRGTIRDTARLGAFIHGIAANLINNFLRSGKRRPRPDPLSEDVPAPDAADTVERDCELALLQRKIARLDERDREVLTLTLAEGLEPEDIARRTGLSQEAVRQRKSRALKRLRQALAGSRDNHPEPQY